jgi:hypothetical protein
VRELDWYEHHAGQQSRWFVQHRGKGHGLHCEERQLAHSTCAVAW